MKYDTSICYAAGTNFIVEADTPEAAAEAAYNSKKAHASLCHQCSHKIDLGDVSHVIICDNEGNEVYNDGYFENEIAKLRAENEKLTKQVRSYAALVKSMEKTQAIFLGKSDNQNEAIATLESEREANRRLSEEITEQARLLGISAEKELTLLAKVEWIEKERDRLLKGEFICRKCGLRKNDEHPRTHDF